MDSTSEGGAHLDFPNFRYFKSSDGLHLRGGAHLCCSGYLFLRINTIVPLLLQQLSEPRQSIVGQSVFSAIQLQEPELVF